MPRVGACQSLLELGLLGLQDAELVLGLRQLLLLLLNLSLERLLLRAQCVQLVLRLRELLLFLLNLTLEGMLL